MAFSLFGQDMSQKEMDIIMLSILPRNSSWIYVPEKDTCVRSEYFVSNIKELSTMRHIRIECVGYKSIEYDLSLDSIDLSRVLEMEPKVPEHELSPIRANNYLMTEEYCYEEEVYKRDGDFFGTYKTGMTDTMFTLSERKLYIYDSAFSYVKTYNYKIQNDRIIAKGKNCRKLIDTGKYIKEDLNELKTLELCRFYSDCRPKPVQGKGNARDVFMAMNFRLKKLSNRKRVKLK